MSAYTLYMLTALGDGAFALGAWVNMTAALRDGNSLRALGWSAMAIGSVILAFAFSARALRI
ncbi:hypothetical protein [Caulobacter sp. 602-1]|uniref:hypothetical protein n=1 Tax=Caulobacter sp. 602-1 TaxID=2492472 RepID=UPI000F6342D3|nr:hypothetical protein [Caulobacter sp. 602-1]RRN64668.1 hypothetical protein EIK80_11575 [Caulobacter sp. 602-1]